MRAALIVLGLPLVLVATPFAQTAPSLQFRGPRAAHASVTAGPADLGAKPGAKVMLFIDVAPNANIHVYAPGAKDYIPITVKVDQQPGIKVGKLTYPKSETMTFADEKVPVFQKPFRLTQEVGIPGSAKAGSSVSISAKVDYQACDDRVCYPPESQNVTWTVAVK